MKKILILCLFISPHAIHGQSDCQVEFYLSTITNWEPGQPIDPSKTQLDSLIIGPEDIDSMNENSFTFYLSKSAANRLRGYNLDFKYFTLVINEEPVLAGRFWGCYSSLGTKGYVIFNVNCGSQESNELHIRYSLPRQDLPDKYLLKNACQ